MKMRYYYTLFVFICIHVYGQGYQAIQEFQIDPIGDQALSRPTILASEDSGFVVLWGTSPTQFFGQWFDRYGEKNGETFRHVAQPEGTNSVAVTKNGVVAVWSKYYDDASYGDIHGRLFDSTFQKTGEEFFVFSNPNFNSNDPSVAVLHNGDFLVVWRSYLWEELHYSILGQRFLEDGERDGAPIQINERPSVMQDNPNIIVLPTEDFVVSWENNGYQETMTGLYCRLFDSAGNPKGPEILIQENSTGFPMLSSITPLSNGFVASWIRITTIGDSIFFCIYDENMNPKNRSQTITTQPDESVNEMSVASIDEGVFVIVWVDGFIDSQIYCQVLNDSGEQIGQRTQITKPGEGQNSQYHPDVTRLKGGGFVVTWKCGGEFNIKGPILGKMYDVKPLVRPLLPFTLIEPKNDATLKTKRVFFCWEQPGHLKEYNPLEITFSLYLDRQPDFSNPLIVENIIDTTYSSMETLLAGTTYFWKVSAINSAGDSLWSSNVNGFYVSPDATDAVEEKIKIPEGFALEQNYPNPFNPSTEIKYTIPTTGFVTLKIYDIQGRLIRVLCDGNQTEGSYTLRWDGKDESDQNVSSGIYVYKLSFKNAQGQITVITRKMGLVR